jgi:hypothetical protein
MAHTFTQCHYHLVFSTKQRAKLIGTDIRERMWKYLTGICRNIELIPVAVGGMDDHIHMLFHLPPDRALTGSPASPVLARWGGDARDLLLRKYTRRKQIPRRSAPWNDLPSDFSTSSWPQFRA